MKYAIDSIEVNNQYDARPININLGGRNLIVTGGNGCGKTRFVQQIFTNVYNRIAKREITSLDEIEKEIIQLKNSLEVSPVGSHQWSYASNNLPVAEKKKKDLENFKVSFVNDAEGHLLASFHQGVSVISYFKADRQVQINKVNAIRSLNLIKEQGKQVNVNYNYDFNNPESKAANFEEYLASLKQVRSFYITEYNDRVKAEAIAQWFIKLESDFKELFEDESLTLNFIADEFSFEISQKGKQPYRFQNLSSGYASILSVYADLIMTVEVRDLSPHELSGIVVIDEVDAHLHISLQKKILSFLTSAYKNIQFIVTTHSPFIVMSVSDAVIYDLSKKQQVDDLSMYSYDSVAKGLFDTLPLSFVLFDKLKNLSELAQTPNKNDETLALLNDLLQELSPHVDKLDSESQFFFNAAKVEFLKRKAGN